MITPIANSLIQLREFTLNKAFSIPSKEVLNPQPFTGSPPSSLELVGMLKHAVNEFKAEAMNENGSRVDYQKLRNTDCYQRYTQGLVPQLQTVEFADLTDRNTATAFWINLYNALVIHAVIEFGVQESIAAGGFGDQVRFFRRAAYNIGGMRFSLEDIEHGILRANRGNPFQFSRQFSPLDPRMTCVLQPVDPRIHFALNCASISCPPIGVYDHRHLDQQLDLASANYIDQETVLSSAGLSISKLFSWYKKDFGNDQDITAFHLKYLPDDERRAWLQSKPNVPNFKYLPYNWGLNI
jgi:hypothetical protein